MGIPENGHYVDSPHEVPACFVSRKVRQQPADFGTCCVARAATIPELEDMARAFVMATRYMGPACLEFKQSADDGRWYFIEVNARLDFWVVMSTLHGVNLPLPQYLLSIGRSLLRVRQRAGGRHWIDLPGDLRGFWRRRHPAWRIGIADIVRPYPHWREAMIRASDPVPGLLGLARGLWRRVRRGTHDYAPS